MTHSPDIAQLQSGKGHKNENFPVASFLIAPRHRPPVMAFYTFVRAADDVADHATATAEEKLALLEQMRASLTGESQSVAEGVALREILAERGLSPVHALDLLEAFRRDCTKLRYQDWDDLIDYCRYSAMPVGRFVLDVHGEDKSLWPANDALCAALQVINHLQDCAKDYRELNRVYIPEPLLAAAGVAVEALGQDKANPALAGVIASLARENAQLLETSRPFARGIRDGRLAMEVDLIQTLADDLNTMLMHRDPLSQAVHHSKMTVATLFLKRFPAFALMRLTRPQIVPAETVMTNTQNLDAPAAKAVKKKASGSSFYIAMRLMPAKERDAMFAIYAFCRKADDIADDGVGTRAQRHEKLEQWRSDLRALYAGTVSPQVRFLAPAVAQYGLRLEDFLAVLDGMDMDVAEDIVAPDLATLDLYCDRVASAVGRLSIKVFGMEEGPGFDLAHHLGRALQLTNILRDVDEDAAIGRLYLPREYLEELDCCRQMDPAAIVAQAKIDVVCRRVATLAHHHYDEAQRILAARPKGRIKTPRLMGAVYSEILRASEAQGFAPPRHRVSLPKGKLLSLVLRRGLFS